MAAASSQDYAKKLDEATSSNDIDQLEVLLDERELRLLMVREDGTYIQMRIMQHYSSIIHSELGNKAFDFHMPISEMNERKYKEYVLRLREEIESDVSINPYQDLCCT